MAKRNPRPSIGPGKKGKHWESSKSTKVRPKAEKRFQSTVKSRPLSTQRVHSIAKQIYAEYHWKSNSDHKAQQKAVNAMSEALLNLYAHSINTKSGQTVTAREVANAIRLMKNAHSPIKHGVEKTKRVSEKLANGKTRVLLESLEKIAFEQADGRLLKSYNAKIKKLEKEHKHAYWTDSTGRKRKIPLEDLVKMVEFASYKTATQLHEANGVLRVWLGKKR